jgi:hypothetical protein
MELPEPVRYEMKPEEVRYGQLEVKKHEVEQGIDIEGVPSIGLSPY